MSTQYEINGNMRGSGFKFNEVAGETLGEHKLVYRGADGYWYLADADSAATMPTLGITMGAIQATRRGEILWIGFIGDGSWAWTAGDEIYASNIPGELTQTPPSGSGDIVQVVAIANSATMIQFQGNVGGSGGNAPMLKGTSSITATNTFVTVTHGLGFTPNHITVTPASELEGRDYWVSNIGATTFRINISTLSLSDDYDFYWRAEL